MSINLSKQKREKMLNTIAKIKENINDDETLKNLSLIEYELTKKKYGLLWEEHEERVDVVGPKKTLARVSVLGPTRKQTQVELSMTDARSIGIDAPIRESGVLEGSAGCKLVGPCGEVELTEGVIVAMRHIHTTPEDAAELGVTNGEVVSLKVDTQERNLIFGDVVVRVSPNYATVVHIDTDEANAANCKGEVYGEIVK